MIDKDKLKANLDLEDIHKILRDLGSSQPKYDKDNNPVYITVCHGGNKHKLHYHEDNKMFHCYTGCGGDNFDIFELVVRAKGTRGQEYSFYDAVKHVSDVTGKSYNTIPKFGRERYEEDDRDKNRIDDWNWINKIKKKEKVNVDLPVYDERVLDVFLPYGYEEWERDGISLETQKEFRIGYYIKNESIIIPHFDLKNKLIGIRQRNTRQEELDNGRKYTPVTVENKLYNHPLGVNLYALHKTKKAISQTRKLMLFEGEKNVLKAQDFYGELNFTCAVCSNNITNFQRDIALSLGVEEIFIAFDKYSREDNEESIKKYQDKLLGFAKKFTPYCRTYILWDNDGLLNFKDAPVDQGKKVFEKLMKQKYEIRT
jgi:hypothetical protein